MSDKGRQPSRPPDTWHAVDVLCGGLACPAAQALHEQRFLSRESPPVLPLPSCTHPGECWCRYRHFGDRRTGDRRSSKGGSSVRLLQRHNRRFGGGRRATD